MASQDDRRGDVIAATIVMLLLSLVSISLRFWSRITSKSAGLWWDDWTSLASVPFMIGLDALAFYWVSLGLGLHAKEAPGSQKQWYITLFAVNLVYNTGLSLVKLSVILFYGRVFGKVTYYKRALWLTGFLVVAWLIANNLLAILQCIPVQSYWEGGPRHCITAESSFLGTTITNILIDVIILILPLPGLWKLHISFRRKLALIGVFICGYCVAIVSVVRLVSIIQLGDGQAEDFSWNFVNPMLMVIIEVPIALFSSCLPATFQLAKRQLERRRFGTAKTTKQLTNDKAVKMGTLGNPTNDQVNRGFVRLQNEDTLSSSQERLRNVPE